LVTDLSLHKSRKYSAQPMTRLSTQGDIAEVEVRKTFSDQHRDATPA
jgi:hypothetical protein